MEREPQNENEEKKVTNKNRNGPGHLLVAPGRAGSARVRTPLSSAPSGVGSGNGTSRFSLCVLSIFFLLFLLPSEVLWPHLLLLATNSFRAWLLDEAADDEDDELEELEVEAGLGAAPSLRSSPALTAQQHYLCERSVATN